MGAGSGAGSDFNPRSPCGERRNGSKSQPGHPDFNPRSPCGERLSIVRLLLFRQMISIHAPRVGSDDFCIMLTLFAKVFQSTLPVWGATLH